MTCDDVRHAVFVYLDGEFAAPEAEDFRRHLDACASCRLFAQGEAGFLGDLKTSLPEPELPVGMEARLLAALAEAPAPEQVTPVRTRRAMDWLAPPLALAAGAMLALGAWSVVASADGADVAVRLAVAAHQTAMPLEVTGGEANVRRFVKANAPFAADVPLESGQGLVLVGARLTQVDGRVAVIYQYDKGGQRVSVLQAVSQVEPVEAARGGSRLDHRQGYGVLTFGSRGLNNAVVGQLPEVEMRGLVPVNYRP
jgi:anti-sigma factor RsiW